MPSQNYYCDYLEFRSDQIPIRIYLEFRPGARFALGKYHFIFRIPVQLTESKRKELVLYGKEWALKTLLKEPSIKNQFRSRVYRDGDLLKCYDRDWKIELKKKRSHYLSLKPTKNTIEINAPEIEDRICLEALSKKLQKTFSKFYQTAIYKQSRQLADSHQLPLPQKVSLSYMSSRWGSCRKRNSSITLNTKLILAPAEVLNSVIIHELAHLVHNNHSLSFWKLVRQCDPNYKFYNNWLKTHGNQLVL